jgi:hypothetical protein
MRAQRRGWTMPREDIPSMLQMIEAKIASSEIEVQHRSALIRLRTLLEDDLQEQPSASPPHLSAVEAGGGTPDHQSDSA